MSKYQNTRDQKNSKERDLKFWIEILEIDRESSQTIIKIHSKIDTKKRLDLGFQSFNNFSRVIGDSQWLFLLFSLRELLQPYSRKQVNRVEFNGLVQMKLCQNRLFQELIGPADTTVTIGVFRVDFKGSEIIRDSEFIGGFFIVIVGYVIAGIVVVRVLGQNSQPGCDVLIHWNQLICYYNLVGGQNFKLESNFQLGSRTRF